MVNNNRYIPAIAILFFIIFFYFFKIDLIFITFFLFFSFYDFLKSNFLELQKLIVITVISFFLLVFNYFFNFFFNQIISILLIFIIFVIIFFDFYRNILFVILIFFTLLQASNILLIDRNMFFLIIALSFVNDTAAFIIGKTLKGPLIIPSISPKKTWSGTFFSFLISNQMLIYFEFNIIYSIVISLSFFLGDIFFSYFKRFNNIKDFSNLLGGHGGFLDRFDSIFLSILILNIYLI